MIKGVFILNIINELVKHKAWGQGKILGLQGTTIDVEFGIGIKKMQFPEGFEKFLIFEKPELQDYALDLLENKRNEAARIEQEKREEQERIKLAKEREMKPAPKGRKKVEKANIAFKCNFCNGGCSSSNIGYKGVCSDEMIDYLLDNVPEED